jgi:aspartate dehydrogenase
MAFRGTLRGLRVVMKKHPSSLKLSGALALTLSGVIKAGASGETVLYEGPVRELCPMAPNNVNTMACAALAGHTLGFDGTVAQLVCDSSLESHIVEITVDGPGTVLKHAAVGGASEGSTTATAGAGVGGGTSGGRSVGFHVHTARVNPAKVGAVTGNATYASFLSSLHLAGGRGDGLHFV